METRERGTLTESKILAAFVEAGYLVSLPFGDGHKYDLIIDDGRRVQRVQCKTGRVRHGSLHFNACSFSGNAGTRRDYKDSAEVFAVLNVETGDVYVIPVKEVGHTVACLRLHPTLSGQNKGIRWAKNYLLTSCIEQDEYNTSIIKLVER
ncbi:MAG: hypothetical protein H0T45_09045 [Pyrinomonadaceae bacterium]|nr:hypothetical protein [Pyrinomonadaceae bacterium]